MDTSSAMGSHLPGGWLERGTRMQYTIAPQGSECQFNDCATGQGAIHVYMGRALCAYHSPFDVKPEERRSNIPTRVGEPTMNDVYITRHADLRARISKNSETGLFEVFHPFTGEKVGSAQTLMAARVIRRKGEARKWR